MEDDSNLDGEVRDCNGNVMWRLWYKERRGGRWMGEHKGGLWNRFELETGARKAVVKDTRHLRGARGNISRELMESKLRRKIDETINEGFLV